MILAATIALAGIALIAVSRFIYRRGIEAVELRGAGESARRVEALVEDDAGQLELLVRDWATWDDTWYYIEDRDPAYERSNLGQAESIDLLGLSALMILDARGVVVFESSKAPDWLPDMRALYRGEPPPGPEGSRGLAIAGGRIHLVASRPVLRGDGSGPVRGTLVMARLVDQARVARYSRLSGLAVSIEPLPSYAAREEAGAALPAPAARLYPRFIEASLPLADTKGRPAAMATIRETRDVGGSAFAYLTAFLPSLALVVLGVGLASVLIFEAAFLGRMRTIGRELGDIAEGRSPGGRLSESGSDELASLVRTMNQTLDALYRIIGQRDEALREIHHRVKNNLQVIASFLSLQAERAPAPEAAQALRESRRRVLSMAFVHEDLYTEADLERVSLDELLERLASACRQGYDSPDSVRSEVARGGLRLRLEKAVPFGLVAGEAISNAFRHAFPSGGPGLIRISASAIEGGGISLVVEDDGIGAPPEAEKGLGLDAIEALASQLKGEYRIGPAGGRGTRFELRTPPDDFA